MKQLLSFLKAVLIDKQYGLYMLFSLFGIAFYSWLWSLLFSVLFPVEGLALPWLAPLLLFNYADNSPAVNTWLFVSLIAPGALMAALVISAYQHKKIATIFGDAHWATLPEIKKMGLLDKDGLVIGDVRGFLLRVKLISHALIFAPSRSGKGVSQVIPVALTFNDSMLFLDLKMEIFLNTSGFRQKYGHAIFLFAPANRNCQTHCWNILDLVSSDPTRMIADLQLICEIIINDKGSRDQMWGTEARAIMLGLLLWLRESGRPFMMGELNAFVKGTSDFSEYLKQILNDAVTADNILKLNPVAFTNINNFVQKAPKEQSGVKSTITASLNLWDDPLINAATSRSDFDIRDMRRKRMTVYIGIPPNQLARLAPLINLFVQFFVNVLSEELPQADEPYKVLAVLDEFTALGRMEKLKNGFGYLAGYNVHLMPVIQNVGQFFELYGGRDNSDVFFQNSDYKIVYRQNTKTDREFVSSELGTRTMKIRSKSFKTNFVGRKETSSTDAYIERPLLTANEVRVFPKTKGIVIISGEQPIRYKRIIYYKDARFKDRILPPVAIPIIEPFYPTLQVKKKIVEETQKPIKEQTTLSEEEAKQLAQEYEEMT